MSERSGRFSPATMHAAARLYYLEDATQGEVAERLGVSRATVSRLLAEARRQGIVRIQVIEPVEHDVAQLARETADALGLRRVVLTALPLGDAPGVALASAVGQLLSELGLRAGDGLLVSSGRTCYEMALGELPPLPGVQVAPMIGGMDEPEPWYATNEIIRLVAARLRGTPHFLYAPALPGAELRRLLLEDASTQRVLELWRQARAAIVGVGAPPLTRSSIPGFVPLQAPELRDAVGDVLSRFYDAEGTALRWPGSDRLFAVELERLRELPVIAVAAGAEKVPSLLAGARAGGFDRLATDPATASALVAAAD